MDVDGPSESTEAAASDSLSESSGEFSVASDGGAAASAESTAEEKPAIYVIQDLPRKSQPPSYRRSMDGPNRRFSHIPVRRICETHPNLRRITRHREGDFRDLRHRCSRRRNFRRLGRCGYLETLFELPFITEDNVIVFSKPQKLKRSVDEVDQLMKELDLRKEKAKVT